MSLRVWLPLNGNLDNLGLEDITVTNYNTVINANGKIGSCYYFNGSSTYMTTSYIPKFGVGDFSISLWLKIPTLTSGTYKTILSSKTSSGASVGVGIYWNVTQKKFLWSTANGTTAKEVWMATAVDGIVYDKWIHLIMVRDSFDSKKGYFYINGIRYELASIPTILDIQSTNPLYIGRTTNGSYYSEMYINDIRIYDHAISAKEAEELSKGLILHYKLDKNFNQLNNCLSYPTFNTSTSTGGWSHWTTSGGAGTYGQNTDQQYIYNKNNTYSHWIASTAKYYLLYQSPAFEGGYRSLQFIIKEENSSPISNTICWPNWNARSGGPANNTWTSITPLGNGFYLCKTDGLMQSGNDDLVGIGVNAGYKIYISEAYCENDREVCSDIFNQDNLTTVIDSSGYGNNATATNVTSTPDSAKYTLSVKSSAARIIHDGALAPGTEGFTFSIWVKRISRNTSGKLLDIQIGNKKFNFGETADATYDQFMVFSFGTNATYWDGSNFIIPLNEWHHWAGTFDGSKNCLYKDGQLIFQSTHTKTYTISGTDNCSILNVANLYSNSYVNDFRLYSTVLTAEQIKELYDTSIGIDSNGNIYAREVIE